MNETSFSVRIKQDITRSVSSDIKCRRAEIAGLFLASSPDLKSSYSSEIKFIPEIKQHILEVLTAEGLSFRVSGNKIELAPISRGELLSLFVKCFVPDMALTEDQAFTEAFVKGLFLTSGYCSDPNKNYRIEFHIASDEIAMLLTRMLGSWDISPVIKDREGFKAIYFKAGDMVSDFLARIGATGAMLDFENIRVSKDINNTVVRRFNCDAGNFKRQSDAGAKRNALIKKLLDSPLSYKLTPDLMEAAKAHIENPGASIAELGQMMDPPIGKSGMSHRLKKLTELANSLSD
ncbi:MAG: DNA-binding protein WhiA [Saccharofermentans sp.]|nr:DNA-binding protein WhiA [Saccharofermentans sp.]